MKDCKHFYKLQPKMLYDICEEGGGFEGCGITTKTAMHGIVLDACAELGYPIVVMQKKLNDCIEKDNIIDCQQKNCCHKSEPCNKKHGSEDKITKQFFRLESTVFYDKNASVCRYLREQMNHEKCQKEICFGLDARVADFLLNNMDVLKDGDAGEIPLKSWGEVFDVPYKIKVLELSDTDHLENQRKKNIVCLIYECPFSGYNELAFLIEVNGIYGIVIVGQCLFPDANGIQKDKIKNHLRKMENEYFSNLNLETEKVVDYVIEEKMKEIVIGGSFDKKKQNKAVDDFWDSATKAMVLLENQLYQRAENRKEVKINKAVSTAVIEFNNNVEESLFIKSDKYLEESEEINFKYEKVCDAFKDVISNNDTVDPGMERLLGIAIKSSDIHIEPPRFLPYVSQNEKANPEERWSQNYSEYTYMDSVFGNPMPRITFENIKDIEGDIKTNKERRDLAEEVFKKFFQHYALVTESLHAKYQSAYTNSLTASMRHELGQLHAGSLFAHKNYVAKMSEHDLSYRDINHLLQDFEEYLHSSILRVDSTRYMNLIPEPVFTYFRPYEGFLYKWKNIYRVMADNLNIDFKLDNAESFDQTRPGMYADKDMIEQVAYNLTNNAFKYSMQGTTISVDCKLSDDHNWYELIVSNYGIPIPAEQVDRLTEPGYRADNKIDAGGNGLGLWFCKNIAEKHGGKLDIRPEFISEFNVSCLLHYDRLSKEEKNRVVDIHNNYINSLEETKESKEITDQMIMDALEELKQKEYFSDFYPTRVNTDNFKPLWIAQNILKGTMKYTFTCSISRHLRERNQQK